MKRLLHRKDGTVVKLVAEYFPRMSGTQTDVDIYALVKSPGSEDWKLHTQDHSVDKSLSGISVEEYRRRKKTGLLAVLSPGEILHFMSDATAAEECQNAWSTVPVKQVYGQVLTRRHGVQFQQIN